jgi:hypothetical protein
MSFRYMWQEELEGSTPTILPQAKPQQQEEGPEEGYMDAVSSSIDVPILVTSYVASAVQPSLSSTPALTTPGPQPPCPIPDSGPGPGSMNTTGVMLMDNTHGMQPPPPVILWLQFVTVAAKVAWMTISQVLSWVPRCTGRNIQPCKQPDLQDDKAPGDTLGDSNSVASEGDANGSVDERLRYWLSFFSKLLQPTALPTSSCLS